jgi:hypothetical protein
MVGNEIVNGGQAQIVFFRASQGEAYGVVIGTSDPKALTLGPVVLSLERYGMADLTQADRSLQLCGDDYVRLAPPSLRQSSPCGA